MPYWAVVFLIIALVAALFGFGGIAGAAPSPIVSTLAVAPSESSKTALVGHSAD